MKNRSKLFTLLIITMMLAAMFAGPGTVSAIYETGTAGPSVFLASADSGVGQKASLALTETGFGAVPAEDAADSAPEPDNRDAGSEDPEDGETPDAGDIPDQGTPDAGTPDGETPGDADPDELLPPPSDPNPEPPEVIVPETIDDPQQIFFAHAAQLNERKAQLNYAQTKMETRLLQLLNQEFLPAGKSTHDLIQEMQDKRQLSPANLTRSEAGLLSAQVFVYINLLPGTDINTIDPYVSEIVNSSSKYDLAAAWVQVSELENLAGADAVRSISLVEPPIHNIGSVTSLGDTVHRADLFRSQSGKNGSGIKIGIISDGVDNRATAQLSGDLPASLQVLSNTVGGDEGTAMLEIVHDLAPGAALYFHDCGNNTLAFNAAITALAEAGCDIICDDIGWIAQPFFEDGPVALHVASVINDYDIIYVSSAGNAGQRHYQGTYVNDGNNYHDKSLYVKLPAGASVRAVLEWNDPFGASANDYDFYLWNAETGDPLAYSEIWQNGSQDPLEFIDYTNDTGAELNTELTVLNYQSQATAKILEMYVYGANGAALYADNLIPQDSIFGHAAVPKVISCGAVRASAPDVIEPFSSQGPVTMLNSVRQKPDICGADGAAVTGVGGFSNPFYGTSAAAPHIAAIAALGWSQDLNQTADQVRTKIMTGAFDLGASGYDTIFGHGRADVLNSFPAPDIDINVKGYARYPNTAGNYSGITVKAIADANVVAATTTDNSGMFGLNLAAGAYTLELSLPGYLKSGLQNITVTSSLSEVAAANAPILMRAGDIDGSGLVDLSDLSLLAAAYGSSSEQTNYRQAADFDRSGLIDLSDLSHIAGYYGQSALADPQPLSITDASLTDATQNQVYAGHTFTASGGTAPYSFTISSGALPSGMNLAANGLLSGTPTASGNYNFTVQVSDGNAGIDYEDFTLTVAPEEQKGWTFMLYSDADNDLEPQLLQDIAEAKAGITADVNMVVLVDRIADYTADTSVLGDDFTDTRLYRITPGTATRISGGTQLPQITTSSNYEANMGDANTLKKFIQFCKANYPADRYALILSNHGGGARSKSAPLIDPDISIENDVCWDDTNGGDCLYTAEISDVLSSAENVDLLVFDACLMGTAEVAYQFRPGNGSFAADAMVASAPNVWGAGLDYQAILARLNTKSGNNGQPDSTMGGWELYYDPTALTALQLGGIMVEEQYDSTAAYSNQSLACYDLSKAEAVKTALDTLARDIYSKNQRADLEAIRSSGSSPVTMRYFDATYEVDWITCPYFDLYDLAQRVNSNSASFDSDTRRQAGVVMSAIDNMIVYSFGGTQYSGFTSGQNGLSVFFPDGARIYSNLNSNTAMWAYQWWYNSIDTSIWWPPNPTPHLYGKLKWCIDGRNTAANSVGNWFEMLDAWYDPWGNDVDGGCNGYQW